MKKTYKKIKYNKTWIIAKIEKFNNGKYGFSTSADKTMFYHLFLTAEVVIMN